MVGMGCQRTVLGHKALTRRASAYPDGRARSGTLRRRVLTAVAVAALGASAVACSAEAESAPSTPILLLVKDKSLRVPDSECSGVIPLNYLHNGADYKVKDSAGRTVGTGQLPPGRAIPALETDFGKAVRIPTICSMSFVVPVAPATEGLTLVVEDAKPIAMSVSTDPAGYSASIPQTDDAASIPLGDLGGGR